MTIEEAINTIKYYYPPENYFMLREALDMAIEALERDIPKTPSFAGEGYWYGEFIYDSWICPNCGTYCEVDFDGKYCPECGQAIDFGEENDD